MIISKPHANKRNPLDKLLSCLDKVQRIGQDRWKACCPSHDDMSPSLAIKNDEGRLLLHCFAGCETENVLAAIGLTFADIMLEHATDTHVPKVRKPFYAGDVLKIILFEVRIVYLCAVDIANGRSLTPPEQERLLLSVSRINHACEVAHGY